MIDEAEILFTSLNLHSQSSLAMYRRESPPTNEHSAPSQHTESSEDSNRDCTRMRSPSSMGRCESPPYRKRRHCSPLRRPNTASSIRNSRDLSPVRRSDSVSSYRNKWDWSPVRRQDTPSSAFKPWDCPSPGRSELDASCWNDYNPSSSVSDNIYCDHYSPPRRSWPPSPYSCRRDHSPLSRTRPRTPTFDRARRVNPSLPVRYTSSYPTDPSELELNRHPPIAPPHRQEQSWPVERERIILSSEDYDQQSTVYCLYTSCQETHQRFPTPHLVRTYSSWQLAKHDALCWLLHKHKLHGIPKERGYWSDEDYAEKSEGRLCKLATNDCDLRYSEMKYKVWTMEERFF